MKRIRRGKVFFSTVVSSALLIIAAICAILGAFRISLALISFAIVGLSFSVLALHSFTVRKLSNTGVSKRQFDSLVRAVGAQRLTKGKPNKTEAAWPEFGNSVPFSLHPGGIGPEYEMASRVVKVPGPIETFALRTKSTTLRDAFARAATGMFFGFEDLLRILRSFEAGMLPNTQVIEGWNPKLLLALARICANQRIKPSDMEDAALLFSSVESIFGFQALGKSDLYVYSEVLQFRNGSERSHTILKKAGILRRDPVQGMLIKANLRSRNGELDAWLDEVNSMFEGGGFRKVKLDHSSKVLFDGISSNLGERNLNDGPSRRVSVIVPSFEGAKHIETTLKCLRDQTWTNLEVIVVDDGSSDSNFQQLKVACSDYENVRLIRQEKNQGAYPARNLALKYATGEFITVHDDDDWSHCQKIQTQAEHLIKNPRLKANMTRHVRMTESLEFTRINNNPSLSQPNFSSLMFRRELIEEIGGWDNVNRGADAEFRDRILAVFPESVEVLHQVPLSFTRTHASSLTAGEISRGYIDPSRLFYQEIYQDAHKRRGKSVTSSDVATMPKPMNMTPGFNRQAPVQLDVVFATDFSFPGGTSTLTLSEIETAAEAKYKVGVLNLFSSVNAGSTKLNSKVLEVLKIPNVFVISLADLVSTKFLLVRHPSVLQYAENLESNISAEKTIVVVNNPPVLKGGKGFGFSYEKTIENALKLFKAIPEVRPESGVTRKLALRTSRAGQVSNEVWPGFVELSSVECREVADERKPVLGRHSRDSELKWPTEIDTLKAVYSKCSEYDVRIMGGISTLPESHRRFLEDNAVILQFDALPVNDFLDDLDFWAYFHSEALTESFGMATVEAMSRGLVVILPKYMEENFGEAAVYCQPHEVRQVIRDFWDSPEKYRRQSALAIDYAFKHYSRQAFLKRMSEQIDESEEMGNRRE